MPLNADTPYASVDEYRAVLDDATASHDDARIESELLAASTMIDVWTQRFFDRDASDVTREFELPYGGRVLTIDDLSTAPASVSYQVGDATAVTVDSDAYGLRPLNATLDGRPYTELRFDSTVPRGAIVSVSGQWGWTAVPAPIKSATIQLASIILLDGPRGTQLVTNVLAGATTGLPQAVADVMAQMVNLYGIRAPSFIGEFR